MAQIKNLQSLSLPLTGAEYTIVQKSSGTTGKVLLTNLPISTSVQASLNNKAANVHNHNLSDLFQNGAITGQAIVWSGTSWTPATISGSGITDHTLLSNIGTNTHTQIDSHISSSSNPHGVTKTQVGLGNVDNTTDLDKPISTAIQTALNGKAAISHTHTLSNLLQSGATNGQSIVWNGTTWIPSTISGTGVTDHTLLTNIGTNTHATIDAHLISTSNPHSTTKTQVGLGNVDNTSDISKPISTLTQGALDLKANLVSTISVQTGTSYTLLVSDNNKIITFNNASDITLTVPTGLGSGFSVLIIQLGNGEVIFTPSGTTINNRQGFTKTAGQFAAATLASYASNTFISSGDMI